MGAAAAAHGRRDADEVLADMVGEAIAAGRPPQGGIAERVRPPARRRRDHHRSGHPRGRQARARPLHRHRRRRHVRASRASCSPAASWSAAATRRTRPRSPPCAPSVRRVARRARRAPTRRVRHGGRVDRDPGEQPGVRGGRRARAAGAAPGGRAGVGDGRAACRRRRRDPRQDHDHVDADRRAAALRGGPELRHRRQPQRVRRERPRRQRRGLRRRGGRERRVVPALHPARGDRHQRRGRPPGPLRHGRGRGRGVRPLHRPDRPGGGFLVACADDPGARTLATVARAAGVDVRTYGVSDDADLRLEGLAVQRGRLHLRVRRERAPTRRRSSCRCPAPTTP